MYDSWNKTNTCIPKWTAIFDNKLQQSACEKITSHQNLLKFNLEKKIDHLIFWNIFKIYLVSQIKSYLILEPMHLLKVYILPLIDYCCVVWENCANGLRKRTDRLILHQNSIARQELKQNWNRWCIEKKSNIINSFLFLNI